MKKQEARHLRVFERNYKKGKLKKDIKESKNKTSNKSVEKNNVQKVGDICTHAVTSKSTLGFLETIKSESVASETVRNKFSEENDVKFTTHCENCECESIEHVPHVVFVKEEYCDESE